MADYYLLPNGKYLRREPKDVYKEQVHRKNLKKAIKIMIKNKFDGKKFLSMTVESAVKLGIDAKIAEFIITRHEKVNKINTYQWKKLTPEMLVKIRAKIEPLREICRKQHFLN